MKSQADVMFSQEGAVGGFYASQSGPAQYSQPY